MPVAAAEDSDTGSGSDSDDGSSDHNELPFLARESVMGARSAQDRANGDKKPVKLNRESQAGPMKLPEAVEAITGVDASHLPHLPVRDTAPSRRCIVYDRFRR